MNYVHEFEIGVAVGYDKTKSRYKDLFWSPVRHRQPYGPYWVDVLSVSKPTAMKNYTSPHCSASWSHAMSLNAASEHHYSPETKEENIYELGSHFRNAHGQIKGT